jgi:nudix motif 8
MPFPLPDRFDDAFLNAVEARLKGLSRRRIGGDARRAAVVVPLCHLGNKPAVLFTKRTELVGTHKGQVSFPGGRVDPDDTDAVATALRELHEEVGIAPDRVRVLGAFHDVMAITGVAVTPVVGYVGSLDIGALQLSHDEIDEAFALSLDELVDPAHRQAQTLGSRIAPLFSAGPHPVWGLTAWILDEVMREGLGFALPPLMSRAQGLMDDG